MSKIDKAAPGQGERALHDDELDAVSGGVADSETVAIQDSEDRAAICGFNPQPDPPGMRRLLGR
jgi:hypothetical protein